MGGEWWAGIEMRHLLALDAVAREGSFRRAATRLGYVQSAISHQIAALEGLIGQRLVDRSRGARPLSLTPAGEILLAHAAALIARVRAAQADLAALDGDGPPTLRVGATPDLLEHLVPSILRGYEGPVALQETAAAGALLAALVCGDLDLALLDSPLPDGPLDAVIVAADEFVLLIQARAPLVSRGGAVSLDELGRLPLIAHAPSRDHLLTELGRHGAAPRFVLDAGAGSAVQGLVAAGLGAAVVPRFAVDERRPDTAVLELDEGLVGARTIAAVWSRLRPAHPEAAPFVAAARAASPQPAEPLVPVLAG